MNIKTTLTGLPILLASAVIQASDVAEVVDPTMEQTRTRTEMQVMGSEDQVRNQQFNRNDMGKGNMNREGDGSGNGSGNKNRLRKKR